MRVFSRSKPIFLQIAQREKDALQHSLGLDGAKTAVSEPVLVYPGLYRGLNLLEAAVYTGQVDIYQQIVEAIPSLQPSDECLSIAASLNHADMLSYLLNSTSLDVSHHKNQPVRLAAEMGGAEALAVLLLDEKVNAGDCQNDALRKAVENNHLEVVKMLVKSKQVDAGVQNSICLDLACEKEHNDMLDFLLLQTNIDASADDYHALKISVDHANARAVTLLFERARAQAKPFPLAKDDPLSTRVSELMLQ